MRSFVLLACMPIVAMTCVLVVAGQPVYAVREYSEVVIVKINAKTQAIGFQMPGGGSQDLRVGPKTWIIKDDREATFADLRVGQRVHAWFIPRGAQAVVLEVLSTKVQQTMKP